MKSMQFRHTIEGNIMINSDTFSAA